MVNETKHLRVFYSWQSDLPSPTNAGAIRDALRAAATEIEARSDGLAIQLDEATRNTSGSPNIAATIFKKIDSCEIYVADITIVTASGAPRPCPNPNVLIELGYAIAQVGWERIVLLYNDAIGSFPSDVPFDIVQNRVAKYTYPSATKDHTSAKRRLRALVKAALEAVILKNPRTPQELRGTSPEAMRRSRDSENLTLLLSQIHLPTLDAHTERLPHLISDSAYWYWESFHGVVNNSLFHVNDQVLNEAIQRLHRSWETTMSYGIRYHTAPGSSTHVFAQFGSASPSEEEGKDWDAIRVAADEMKIALKELLTYVRKEYVEIDTTQTSNAAWNARHRQKAEFDEMLKRESETPTVTPERTRGEPTSP